MSEDFLNIYFLILILFGAFVLIKRRFNSEKTFKHYLVPELNKYGFQFISSKYYRSKLYDWPFDTLDQDIIVNAFFAGLGVVNIKVHRHLRKVLIEDQKGKQHELIAGIEFDGFFDRKFKRVRWKPELHTISN